MTATETGPTFSSEPDDVEPSRSESSLGHEGSLIVSGSAELNGTVAVGGFKHAFVSVIGGALMGRHTVAIENAPSQLEATTLLELVRSLGASATRVDDRVVIDTREDLLGEIDTALFDSIHGGIYILPSLLARGREVALTAAGGCTIGDGPNGSRPNEHYARVIERFGGEVYVGPNRELMGRPGPSGLIGCEIDMADFVHDAELMTGPLYSGATKFAILCAVGGTGDSRIRAPYPKADVTELLAVLRGLGARVDWEDDTLLIGPGTIWSDSVSVTHELVTDVVQVVTWVVASVLLGSSVTIRVRETSRMLEAMAAETDVLRSMGVTLAITGQTIRANLTSSAPMPAEFVVSSRSVFSDVQPLLAVLLSTAEGVSSIKETVWRSRFGYASQLRQMGYDNEIQGDTLVMFGRAPVASRDRTVAADDLRAAAALVIAALRAPGSTTIVGTHHLDRGYPDFIGDLRRLGGNLIAQ